MGQMGHTAAAHLTHYNYLYTYNYICVCIYPVTITHSFIFNLRIHQFRWTAQISDKNLENAKLVNRIHVSLFKIQDAQFRYSVF